MIPGRRAGTGRKRRRLIFDNAVYAKRNVIERLIGWLRECRWLATRYETYARCYLFVIKLDTILR
jgi:transposase